MNPFAALGLTLFQIALVLFVTGGHVQNLVHWDSAWYRDNAILGYRAIVPIPEGVQTSFGFFPGFPMLIRGVYHLLGAPNTEHGANLATTLAAQVAALGVWTYFLLLLRRFKVRPALALAAVATYMVLPGAFYLVIGYSESLFVAGILGHIYWSMRAIEEKERRGLHSFLAILHGGIMTSTRFLGVVLPIFSPLLVAARALREGKLDRIDRKEAQLALFIGVLSLWGIASFVLYSHLSFGQWDLYWDANRKGWNVYPKLGILLSWSYYSDVFFTGNLSEVLGRVMTVLILIASGGLCFSFWRRRKTDALPLALAVLNLVLLFETAIGSCGMHSMIRYLLPIQGMTLLLAAQHWELTWPRSFRNWAVLTFTGIFLLAIQVLFAIRYARNEWVS